MGVYINMEMPKDGYRQVFIDSNGTVTWFNNGADGPNTMYKAKAVPVPPHGRLIDADALRKDMAEDYYTPRALGHIDNAPTVIPAEEGE